MRLIRTAAEVFGPRGDEKSGCRYEWIEYVQGLTDIKSRFCSHRSNHFNNVFENASEHHVISFLESYVSHSNLKLKSILQDIKDEKIMNMMRAFAKFNHLVSYPYRKLMNSDVPYSDFHFYVKKLKNFLEESNPNTPAVFYDFEDLKFDLEFDTSSHLYNETFNKLCTVSLEVLQSQLIDFFDDGIFAGSLPHEVHEVLKTCPLTNLVGERLFGDLDFDMSKRRRASLHLRTSINMWKHNGTGHWMSKKKKQEAVHLLTMARKNKEELKKRCRESEKDVRRKIREQLEENERKKKEREITERERHLKIVTDVLTKEGYAPQKKVWINSC